MLTNVVGRGGAISLHALFIILMLSAIALMLFLMSARREEFDRTLWASSFDRGWYPEVNCYVSDDRYENVGIVIVWSGRTIKDEPEKRRLFVKSLLKMREEYGKAFSSGALKVMTGPVLEGRMRAGNFNSIHIILISDIAANEMASSCGIMVDAGLAFDSHKAPDKVVQDIEIVSNCYWRESINVGERETIGVQHFPLLQKRRDVKGDRGDGMGNRGRDGYR